jgi:hypothetical protein
MAFVLTENSSVTCATQGTVSTEGQSKLKVSGGKVLVLDGIVGKSISNCGIKNTNSTTQCTKVASASGTAAKLKVNGRAVALSTLTGQSDGTTPAVSVTAANQTILKAS